MDDQNKVTPTNQREDEAEQTGQKSGTNEDSPGLFGSQPFGEQLTPEERRLRREARRRAWAQRLDGASQAEETSIPEDPQIDHLYKQEPDEDDDYVDGPEEDLPLEDEPEDAPPHIRARDQRRRIPSDASFLKIQQDDEPDEADNVELVSEAPPGPVRIRFGVMLRSLGVVGLVASITATMFTWWTPNTFLPTASMDQLSMALATQSGLQALTALPPAPTQPLVTPTLLPPPDRIGIVAGHRGVNPSSGIVDPGAVCSDGLTELDVTEVVADQVVSWLTDHGYEVDLLDEFDTRLQGYRARVMVSIHVDSCEYINEFATGFKVASFAESNTPEEDARLVSCMIDRYADTTGLSFHPSVTYDMTQYHTFREVAPGTAGAIIEVGFLYLDRTLLTENPDLIALGVARGILCYLRDEPVGGDDTVPGDLSDPVTETPVP